MTKLGKLKDNEVFHAVEAAGLRPQEFLWDDDGEEVIYFRHQSTDAYFVFGGRPGNYVTRSVAGEYEGPELTQYTWPAVMARVELWLYWLRHDIETPDLWDELRRQTEVLAGSWDRDLENTPFTIDERAAIAGLLDEFRENARTTYSLSTSQLADLDSKLDYLVNAADHLGRKDWKNACIGALIGYVLSVAFPPDATRHIIMMLVNGITPFFGHGFPGLGSG
jgi:hypothetical protein